MKIGGTKQCCVPILDCRNASKTGTVFFSDRSCKLQVIESKTWFMVVVALTCSNAVSRGERQDAGYPESPETVPEVCTHYQGIR